MKNKIPQPIEDFYGLTADVTYVKNPLTLDLYVGGNTKHINEDMLKLLHCNMIGGRDIVIKSAPPEMKGFLTLPHFSESGEYLLLSKNKWFQRVTEYDRATFAYCLLPLVGIVTYVLW